MFQPGLGEGHFKAYSLTGEACVEKCVAIKKDDPLINGVAIYSNGRPGKSL